MSHLPYQTLFNLFWFRLFLTKTLPKLLQTLQLASSRFMKKLNVELFDLSYLIFSSLTFLQYSLNSQKVRGKNVSWRYYFLYTKKVENGECTPSINLKPTPQGVPFLYWHCAQNGSSWLFFIFWENFLLKHFCGLKTSMLAPVENVQLNSDYLLSHHS